MQAASACLAQLGLRITAEPQRDCRHLLLPIPSFSNGEQYLEPILEKLPENVIISGGNLSVPMLQGYQVVDFLTDPYYLAENAAITATCAAELLSRELHSTLAEKRILILGFGRIGKCLCREMIRRDAKIAVAARKETDLALIHALGMDSIPISGASAVTERYDGIVNTVPSMVLPHLRLRRGACALELASVPGMAGADIIPARGLPGRMAPEVSGELIAKTFIRLSL